MSFLGKRTTGQLPEEWKTLDAGLTVASDMIHDNARRSLHDGRLADAAADCAQGIRFGQMALHELIRLGLAGGSTFEDLAAEMHLSPEYLKAAYEQFDPGRAARPGPDEDGREPWPVLG